MQESAKHIRMISEAAAPAAQLLTDRCQAVGTEVCVRRSLEPSPYAFHGVEFGGVRREAMDRKPSALGADIVQGFAAAMGEESVPDQNHRPSDVAAQVLEETDNLPRADGPRMSHQKHARALRCGVSAVGQGTDGREVLPVAQPVCQNRRLSAWRPGAADRRALREPTLVDEDDGCPPACGFFFIAGQVVLTQR